MPGKNASSSSPPARTQTRGARTRARLLDATNALIARKGVGAFTARDVVGEAGSSLGVLTHHFPTRRDLLAGALARHRALRDGRAAEAATRATPPGDPRSASLADLTDRAIVLLADRVHQERDAFLAGVELDLESIRDPDLASGLPPARDAFREAIHAMVLEAGSDEPELDAELLAVALEGLGLEWIRHAGDDAFSGRLGLAVRRLIERFLAPGA